MSFGRAANLQGNEQSHIGPQERIAYQGELSIFLEQTLSQYDLGDYRGHEVKQNGYEDFNVVAETSTQKVFVKCFADWRSREDCRRYIEMMLAAGRHGAVTTPRLYKNRSGFELSELNIGDITVYLCAMQFLDGGNIWESGRPLSLPEKESVIHEAAKISQLAYRPQYVKDSWAVVNLPETYTKNRHRIDEADRSKIDIILGEFESFDIQALPTCFVHGDIRTTNVMRHSDARLHVIDFSVANIYPRIMELAVLFSDVLFEPESKTTFEETYRWALDIYADAGVNLGPNELRGLPLFVKMAHAANVIGASSVEATQYISKAENEHWLKLGKQGLHRA